MFFRLLFIGCFLGLSLGSAAVHATVVVHSLKEQVKGWHTTLDASYASSSTTVDKTDYKGSFRLSNNDESRQWLLFGNLAYSDVNGKANDDSTLLHGRYIRKNVLADVNIELFVQRETDDFEVLAQRRLYGGGLSLLNQFDGLAFHSLAGIMNEREEHLSDPSQDRDLTRFTLSSQLQYQLPNKAVLTAVVYFQPSTSDMSDYRSTFKADIAFPLVDRLELKVGYSWRYNGEAFVGVPPIKRAFTTGVSYHF